MRRGRGAGLAGLAAVLLVAAGRAQVQQEPSAETSEGTGVAINCSHPNIQSNDYILWYRQLPGRAPAFLALALKGSKELQAPPGRLSVAADRRSSALWLARPRRGDAAVYYCALGDTGRGAGAAAGCPHQNKTQAEPLGAAQQGSSPIYADLGKNIAPRKLMKDRGEVTELEEASVLSRNSNIPRELRTPGEGVKPHCGRNA
ncbi:uncharacterized protein LOC141970521 [Athene noctua]|uniref:uncharacterized protein LOC141970521 n=1 Tax=Athene noctua TaxID=126797 RepID=UPI003EC03F6C